jgi:pullulanase
MDVVFNHTAAVAPFDHIVPNYYYRLTEDGNYWNGSGTGNEMQTEYPMVRKLIVDSCRFWVEEYGIDGYRFDLMGLIDMRTMLEVRDAMREIDPSILVYGEPWTAGPSGIAEVTDKRKLRTSGIGAFNDHFRDAIKGGTRGNSGGYVQAAFGRDGMISGLEASIHDWAWSPNEVIQYMSAHDDLCLWDKLVASTPGADRARLKGLQKMAGACVLVAQGISFIYSGEDICRTKQGNPNPYNAGDEVNKIHWDWKIENREVFEYYRGLIALRRTHPLFRLPTSDEIKKRVHFPEGEALPAESAIIMLLDGADMPEESAEQIAVLFNPELKPMEFALPVDGEWLVVVDDKAAGPAPLRTASDKVKVAPSSVMVLVKPKTTN